MATAESYVGSLLSLTSKSEIRYEGVLYTINTDQSTIGLRNVRSFGTEGRKKNGPQVPAGDKIYDYILFRGSDIKDLQVKSSPSVQPTSLHNDPAIIQSHYPHVASASPMLPPIGSGNVADLSSNTAQLGLPSSTFQSNLPPYQPGGNLNSWGPAPPPPSADGSGLPMPMYWPGYYAPSGGIPQLLQPSLLQPPTGLPIPHSAQQPLQYPGKNLPVSSGSPNLPDFTASLHPSASNIPTSTFTPLQSASTATQASAVSPPTSEDLMVSKSLTSLPASVPGANLASVPPSTTSDSVVRKSQPMTSVSRGSSRSVSAPIMAYRPVSRSMPSATSASSSTQIETSVALITPGQLLQPGPTETITRTMLPDPSVRASNISKGPVLPLPKPAVQKTNGASQMHQHNVAPGRGIGNQTYGASHLHTYNRGPGRGNEANGGSLIHPHNRGPGRGGNMTNGGPQLHHYNRGPGRGRGNETNGGPQMHHYNRGPGRGRGNEYPRPVARFTEDFDFTAMNEKFKKDEVWGELGNMKAQPTNKEGEAKDAGLGEPKDNDTTAPKIDVKPVYCKDDFFDLLSCTPINNGPQNGRARFSEQVKLDTETFGELQQHRFGQGAPGYRGSSPAYHGSSRGRGFHYGRGQGYIGRGRGHGNAVVYRPRGDI